MNLQQENESLKTEIVFLKARLDELEELVRHLHRNRFAAKSESLTHPGMRSLFEDDQSLEQDQNNDIEEKPVKAHTRKTTRKPIPDHLPRIDIPCLLSDEEKNCSCCGQEMTKISEKFSEKLHIIPRKLMVHRYIMPVLSCKKCETAAQAKMPAHPLPKAGVTIETLAHIIVNKYSLGLPLYRQEKAFAEEQIDIGRDKMSRWLVSLAEKVKPVKDLMYKELISGDRLAMDETSLQVLKEKERRADKKSFMLVQAREGPSGRKITVFHYEKSRSSDSIAKYLDGFRGSLLTDGLQVYQTYCEKRNDISHGGCWSHGRRKFADAVKGKKSRNSIAKEFILLIKELFAAEDLAKNMTDNERAHYRQKQVQPIISKIEKLLNEKINNYPKSSLTGKALGYLDSQWDHLTRFLDDPRLAIHNNYVERQIKPFVIGRKSWLFADTEGGAHANAIFYSLINTAKENDLNSYDYVCKLLRGIADGKTPDNLLPFAF